MIHQRVTTYGPWLAVVAALIGISLFVLAGAYTFWQQEAVNRKLCQQTVENRDGNRTTWEAARALLLQTTDNPENTNRFFDAILETIPPLECIDNKPVVKEDT